MSGNTESPFPEGNEQPQFRGRPFLQAILSGYPGLMPAIGPFFSHSTHLSVHGLPLPVLVRVYIVAILCIMTAGKAFGFGKLEG